MINLAQFFGRVGTSLTLLLTTCRAYLLDYVTMRIRIKSVKRWKQAMGGECPESSRNWKGRGERFHRCHNFHVVFIIHVILLTVRHRVSSWGMACGGIFSSSSASSVSLSGIKSLSLSFVSKYFEVLESSNLELGPATG
jgi:hypothetical protein